MTKKQFGCFIGFILSACVVLYFLCDLFEFENAKNSDRRFTTYRNLNENTVDAVIIGTSGIDRYWIGAHAYEEYGMTVYPLATDGQPSWLYEYVIEEACAYQDPELIIIDMRPYGRDNAEQDKMDANARMLLDSMEPLSLNRVRAGLKCMKIFHENFEDTPRFDISYLLSVVKYHEEWKQEGYSITSNLFNKEHAYLGYFVNKKLTVRVTPQERVVYDPNYYEPLSPLAEQSFYELMDYLKKKDKEVLFLFTPKYTNAAEMGRMNTFMDILDEEGINYINYGVTDENGDFLYDLQLDPATDFYNMDHVNYYGAEKFSRVFAAYLNENYDLPDRRGEAAVQEQWNGISDRIKSKVSRLKKKAEQQ